MAPSTEGLFVEAAEEGIGGGFCEVFVRAMAARPA